MENLEKTLSAYLACLAGREARGDAREESFYSCFEELLTRCAACSGQVVEVTTIPRKTRECLLDFQVWAGGRVAGYVEAKAPGTDLDKAEDSEQVRRYRRTFPNLLLTDFREIRLFRKGGPEARVPIAPGHATALRVVLGRFFSFGGVAGPASAAGLAGELAARTRVMADRVLALLREEQERGQVSRIGSLLLGFREYLRAGLDEAEFADLYAQTIVYGLLAARLRETGRFDRATAIDNIPPGSGILRDVFEVISLGKLSPAVGWVVEDVVDLLTATPIREIIRRDFDPAGKDVIQHFYETFLHAYDKALRKSRGVYYTPRPVVSFMVRAVHSLLRSRFGRADGLADPDVVLLDPAAGTLTFLVQAFAVALDAYRDSHGPGGIPALIRDHLLPHFHAFELMMAPYAIGHWKARQFFAERGFPLADDQRVRLSLTNALELEKRAQMSLPGMGPLARESNEAWRVKKELPVTVILGNPPWSGRSENKSQEIDDLLKESYHRVDGEPLGERNPKWLQDDSVKFLRFGQTKIEENGEGILCFVLPHGFLDNPTFRGLRRSLLETFDEIRVLDLHGNRRKRETCADGAPDENVFEGVEQGVAIALLVKKPGLPKRVLRADCAARRVHKHLWLEARDVEDVAWTEVRPRPPAFLFVAGDDRLEAEYARGAELTAIFPVRSVGVLTARDEVAIGFDRADLAERLAKRPWRLSDVRAGLLRRSLADGTWEQDVEEIMVRPFDRRVILYADSLVDRRRAKGMEPLRAGDNLGLVVPRQARERPAAFITDRMIAHKAVSAYDINSVFPLRLATDPLFGGRKPNLGAVLLHALGEAYGAEPSPEAILFYVYAVLHSPQYRKRYAPFLRAGFPRIPFPASPGLFARLGVLGAKLVDLHLLRSERLREPRVRCTGDGEQPLGRRRLWEPGKRRVVLGDGGLCFEGIEPEVWAHRIGGYQVLDRWLAARAGRRLTLREIEDFRRAAAAVAFTIEVQFQIERLGMELDGERKLRIES